MGYYDTPKGTLQFTQEDADKVREAVKAPHVNVIFSTLGGIEYASIGVKISIDPKETWANGIYENSRNVTFWMHGKTDRLEASPRRGMPSFRKAKIKSVEQGIEKIQAYLKLAI